LIADEVPAKNEVGGFLCLSDCVDQQLAIFK
jgi:hypothetical protein